MKIDWNQLDTIDKEFIFKFLTQESIFERYLKLPVDEDEFYINPLRNDKYPDCKYFYQSNGRLWFVDFAGISYDCFNVVQTIFRCNYWTACRIIAKDFGLLDSDTSYNKITLNKSEIKREKIPVTIRVKQKRYWTKEALAFWEQFGLNLTRDELINELHVHGIYSLDAGWLEYPDGTLKQVYDYNKYKPAYFYQLDEGYNYQLYFPYNSKDSVRFMQNRNDLLHYYKQLPERGKYVVITKSRKDAFFLKQFGVIAIAVLSERGKISKDIMINLQLRFTYVFTLFDSDWTGKRASVRMKQTYQTIPLLFSGNMKKDFSDNLREEGIEYMSELIEEIKQKFEIYG